MIKETKIQKESIERHKFCDICGIEIHIGLTCSVARCSYCRKDLCNDCVGNEEDTFGDYRDVSCKKCWEIGEPYRLLTEELHSKIEALNKEWHDKCKETEI